MIEVIELLKRASTCAFYAENIKLYEDINNYLEHPGTETSNDLINDINYLITKFEDGKDANDYWRDISDLRYNLLNVGEALFAPPNPEPVAWMYERETEDFTERTLSVGFEKNFDGITIPLYAVPPKPETTQDHDLAYIEASSLALSLHKKFYAEESPNFELCDSTAGIITQIDNMTYGLKKIPDEHEPEPLSGKWWYGKGVEDTKFFLKREPLSVGDIQNGLSSEEVPDYKAMTFIKGIKFAEKTHNIGVDDANR